MPGIEFAASARQADAIARAGLLADPTALGRRLRDALAGWDGAAPGPARPLPDGVDVEPGRVGVVALAAGDRLAIAQVDGHTCADVVAWGPEPGERLSPAHTRAACGANPTAGAVLVSEPPWERPLLAIAEDTAPGHDLLFPACSPGEFAAIGCAPSPSCRELHGLAAAAAGHAAHAAPEPLNLWFRSWTGDRGGLAWARTPTAPGDAVALEALADCRVAVNPCVSDVFGCSPFGAGAIRLAPAGDGPVELVGTRLPPPTDAVRIELPDDLAPALAARAERDGADAPALVRALVLALAVADLAAGQAGGR